MKGPSGRLKYTAYRAWECPVCRRRERTGGEVVHLLCACLTASDPARQTWMRLLEEKPSGLAAVRRTAQLADPPLNPIQEGQERRGVG